MMELKKNQGTPLGEFHRCDAPLADEQDNPAPQGHTQATGACEPTISDPNQWNQWAERISAGALRVSKPD